MRVLRSTSPLPVTVRWTMLFILATGTIPIHAEPPVIYDSGRSRPITDYVAIPAPQAESAPVALPSSEAASAEFLAGLFPVHTPELTPGPVAPAALNFPIPQPFFLIGSDPLSRRWLAKYREKLAKANAIGLVVEVPTLQDYQALQKIAGDIQLTPASGSDLIQGLQGIKLSHYPVLISSKRIEQ